MSNLNELFPGCEALMEDVEINNNVSVPSEQIASEVAAEGEAADVAETGAEIAAEGEATEQASEMFTRQFCELCAMKSHVEKFGVDRTFLSLCNRDNILGRAFGISMPACESFDTVGSPYSPVSVACMEAMSDGLWQKFKDFIAKIYHGIRNFITKVADWFRAAFGNWEVRIGKLRKWLDQNAQNANLKIENDKEFYLYESNKDISTSMTAYKNAIDTELDNVDKGPGKEGAALAKSAVEKVHLVFSRMISPQHTDGSHSDSNHMTLVADYAGDKDPDIGRTAVLSADDEKKLKTLVEEQKKAVKEIKKFSDKWKKEKTSEVPADIIRKQVKDTVDTIEKMVIKVRDGERRKSVDDKAFTLSLEKINQTTRRDTGRSLGSRTQSEMQRTINLATQYNTSGKVTEMAYGKGIGFGFKVVSSYISCVSGVGTKEKAYD